MLQATSISRISRRWFKGVVYNLELKGKDPQRDDLFWVEHNTGIVTHNCLPKDLAEVADALAANGLTCPVTTGAMARNIEDRKGV